MWRFLGKRLLQMLGTLILFQLITYLLIDLQPGDIADLLTLNPEIPPSESVRLRIELGLNRPRLQRAIKHVTNFYQGNLGLSFSQYPRKVIDIIKERLPRTLVLFLTANIISFWAGYMTGKVLAWRRGGLVEYASTIAGVTLYTVFTPWFALMMIWLFAATLHWLPAGKFLDPIEWLDTPDGWSNVIFTRIFLTGLAVFVLMFLGFWASNRVPRQRRLAVRLASLVLPVGGAIVYWVLSRQGAYAWDIASHLILPVLTVTLIAYGGTMLLMRTSMLETLREDYILTARAKGMPDKVVRDKHAARNALLPVWTGLVFSIGRSISGGIITETVFSWPGIGLALLNASVAEDIPLALGILTILGVLTLVSHLVADIGYAFLDPRIRYH